MKSASRTNTVREMRCVSLASARVCRATGLWLVTLSVLHCEVSFKANEKIISFIYCTFLIPTVISGKVKAGEKRERW